METYGLQWTDRNGRTVTEDLKPLILLGEVALNRTHLNNEVRVSFDTGGNTPYWLPVIRSSKANWSLMIDKADLSISGTRATYTFSLNGMGSHANDSLDIGNAEIKIYYGVI